jgi:hypothetical protein
LKKRTSMSYAVQLIIPEEKDKTIVTQLSTDEALQYMVAHNFCNQHQLMRDKRKIELRKDFFRRYFEQTNVYLVNTTGTPQATQKEIRAILSANK